MNALEMNEEARASKQVTCQRSWAGFGWTRSSYFLLSAFLATLFLLATIWWPLAEEYLSYIDWSRPLWKQIDWLLIGIFLAMSTLIMAGADIKADVWILTVGLLGGLIIESWGTQTELWTYYTLERPPLWIIPAWPIASLSIDRLVRLIGKATPGWLSGRSFRLAYWSIFPSYYMLMLIFVWPTVGKPLTVMALLLCALLILTPTNHRLAVLTFLAGAVLGYFLERWGTTRLCWTYYTGQTPPLFAVLAHGMAAVAFWRSAVLLRKVTLGLWTPAIRNWQRRGFAGQHSGKVP
ncbi:MAG TPA: hypothetical protein DEP47_01590 [Chloroflexi bacterium]|nr:hypothetical protein [Chloroflexota bacterium]